MIELYKKRGETPLEALERLRVEKPELKQEVLSYAGRLDPMAEGVLVVLVGKEENQRREEFLNKNKEYQAEFILGYSTDTGDVLGLLTDVEIKHTEEKSIKEACSELTQITKQTYPWYSSKTVNGIPLFEYAQKKDFSITRPTREVSIYGVSEISIKTKNSKDTIEEISSDIQKVTGNFRQFEILDLWQKQDKNVELQVVSIVLKVSSGTYIRTLSETLSQKLSVPVVLCRLVRTKIF